MKKLVLLLAVVFGMSMISCTEKAAEQTQETVDSTVTVAVDTTAAVLDSAAQKVDSVVAAAGEEVKDAVKDADKK